MSERSLDPADWEAFRELSHRMVDDMVDHLRGIREQPAWQAFPPEIRARIAGEPLPHAPQGEAAAYADFIQDVFPYRVGNIHPRFSGWVMGGGVPLAAMADMLAANMNPHSSGYAHAPTAVELKVIDWLKEMLGFPMEASGILQSGGSMANLTGLAVARNAKAGFDVREEGVGGAEMVVYGSAETHSWAKKSMEVLGLGRRALRVLPCHADFTMDISQLRERIREDRAAGRTPIAVLATAGTVNTGATDDLHGIADICEEEGVWMHVDGAFGALAAISPRLRPLVAGMERADSVAFDLHKWMNLPFEIACVLVRDADAHRDTFSQRANYLAEATRGVIAGGLGFAGLGIELTRGFKALKAWMCLKAYGVDHFIAQIDQSVDQAQHLGALVQAHPSLELLAPAPLNVVCFRYVRDGVDLDAVNAEILLRLQERGIAVPSSTLIGGQFAIRSAIINHRTRMEDMDALASAVVRLGEEI